MWTSNISSDYRDIVRVIKLVYWYLLPLCNFFKLNIRDFFRQCHSLFAIFFADNSGTSPDFSVVWCYDYLMLNATQHIFLYCIWWVFNKFSQVQNENTCVLHLLAEIKSCLHIWVHSSAVAISKIKVVLAESLGVLVNHCKGVTCFSELSWNSCHIIVVAMLSSKGFIKVLQSCQGFAWIMKKVAYS